MTTDNTPESQPEAFETEVGHAPSPRHRGRVIVGLVAVVVVALGGVIVFTHRSHKQTAVAPAPVLKAASVESGDLTTTERISGTLVLSSSINVLHRIEGQTSSQTSSQASGASASASSGASNTGSGSSRTSPTTPVSAGQVTGADCSGPTTTLASPPPPSTTSTVAATTTSIGDTTSSTEPSPSTTTPSTTAPSTTLVPCTPTPLTTPTTSPGPSTATSTPSGAPVAGNGGGAGGGPAGGTAGASGGGATATRVTQTITSVIATGATVGLGDLVYSVDNQSVVALSGVLPAWRTLSTTSTDGPDIQQLESSLVALGYDPGGKVKVDNHFDSNTKTMVKAWQTGLGDAATGTVALGSVVFVPTTTTVLAVTAKVGDKVSDGSAILTLATDTQQVVIDVPNGDEANVVPGLTVAVANTTGTVTLLRSTVRSGAVVVQAVISPTAPIQGASNGATVSVTLTLSNMQGVLIAPAQALVSKLDGSYAVQVQAADGTTSWHTVELLGVSGNKVAIRGDGVTAGTVVMVPA